ncbi:flavohemoglobin expression-modulating QEGLA motif protein [Halovulum sp. GXIMD14794]
MMDTAGHRFDDALSRIRSALHAGEVCRHLLPDGLGEIYIDRLQPFLCVYRQPAEGDAGTAQLLLGQASYLRGDASEEAQEELFGLVSALTNLMLDAYGAALVLELWSAPEPPKSPDGPRASANRYRIVAETHGVSRQTIEALEHALLAAGASERAGISVEYRSRAAPPGLRPVLSRTFEDRDDVYLLGLEVPAHYRDAYSGKVIPGALRQVTRHLGRALRQAFYAFSHAHAQFQPVHFHELGPNAMAPEVEVVDRGFASVGDAFDLLLHATPVNAEAAYARFVASGYDAVPEFLYRPLTVDPGALKLSLYQVPLEAIEDPALHHIFAAQRDELDRQITMLGDRGTHRFLLESQQVFGGADAGLKKIAANILMAESGETKSAGRKNFTAAEFAREAESELAYYRKHWPGLPARVELRDDIPGVMVSKGHLLVGRNARVREDRVAPLLHHEIGTHVLTYYNGQRQPLSQFHTGMPGYEETQEGLAVLSEYLCGGLSVGRLRMLAGRVLAVDCVIAGADFVETYRVLTHRHGFGDRDAFTISMRVHRGGGLTKDVVYLRGLIELLDHLARGHPLDDLFLGKVTLEHMEIVEELRWRQILEPGPLRPRYLDAPDARDRLEALPSGSGIAELLDEVSR